MRYGIFADVHSNLEALEAVASAYNKESIDSYLCAGDIVGYAADPCECINRVKLLGSSVVAGNHDWAAVGLFPDEYFNPLARQALAWTRKNLDAESKGFLKSLRLAYSNNDLAMVHGTPQRPQDFDYLSDGRMAEEAFGYLDADICFIAHTHVPGIYAKDASTLLSYTGENYIKIKAGNKYIVNVGSVGQPRDGNPDAAYCVFDTEKGKIHIKRVSYDVETARKKIIDAGLPMMLGDRLLTGR